ncbi:RNA polymerase factor sigma-54 [Sphingomonas sinipercae]|uniref:RNA polymerase sigma-54 factor n=1 Tax=Sphingomonas sinipercae TaxID=2714944 RepID=A0A6G7ZKI6_9SPHN|nr:RNA polymerase factor sigma-54 [Sphingomonas sinipercae]QIL01491.1 RNA polymerase factor sigma-54 [Sphingomonas sinipercae]
MGLGPTIQLRQSQQLVMTPQLTQAIKLLTLSNLELEAAIAEEVANNPLLEMASGEEGGDGPGESEPSPDEPGPAEDDRPLDYDFEQAALETDSFTDVTVASTDGEGFDFDRLEACETSLCEHLMAQLFGASGTIALLAQIIVQQLDETGYLTTPLSDIASDSGATKAEAEQALALVQSLDPPGIGARDLSECLALQAKAADRYDPAMARLIDNLELLAKGRMSDLKRICGVDDEDLHDMVRELRAYDPKPGCAFSAVAAEEVAPDVFVRRTAKGFAVELNGAALPRLLVNRRYYQELKRGPQDGKSKAWLSECLASANWLVRALDQRARTIVKVVSKVVERQQGFFDHGVAALKPLTLREIAEAIEMHESTVSRVTTNKYLLCDRGVFELKYFFGSGVASAAGDGASAEAVKAGIREIVAAEREVLSDDAIAELLKRRGFDCARRTVVKYRESMGIGSSVQRRRQRKISGG